MAPVANPAGIAPPAPMRVLLYYPDFGQQGGIERYIETVVDCFQGNPGVSLAVAVSAGGPLEAFLRAKGVTVFGIQTWPGFVKPVLRALDLPSLLQLKRAVAAFKPDVIHVQIGSVENIWLSELGVPVLYTFHGYGALYHLKATQNPLKRFLKSGLRLAFRDMSHHVTALQFVSGAEQARMVDEGFVPQASAGTVLHNAVDLAAWRNQVASASVADFLAQYHLPQNARLVSFISRLDGNKNPLAFVQLAQQLLEVNPDEPLHFVMAGSGPLAGDVQARVDALGLSARIHLLGHVRDIPALLAASDLVVHLPSEEGFGMGVLEAMAAGVPCLAYQVGGIPEVQGADPRLALCRVEPHNAQALLSQAQALLDLDAPAREALQAALLAQAQQFDLPQWQQKLEGDWRRVASTLPHAAHLALETQPLVSVIMPVYNGEAYIERAVRSVLNQSYGHLELLVVDDGSTDQTRDILARIADPRLRVLTQANQGVSEARNHAAREAKGAYLSFLDADDLWFPQKLSQDMARLLTSEDPVGVVYSSYFAVDESDRLVNLPKIPTESGHIFETVLVREGMLLPSVVTLHRSVFDAVGGFTADSYHEDRVFFLRVAKRFPVYATGQRLVAYRQSLSGRCRRILKDFDLACSAEASIAEAMLGQLTPDEHQRLQEIQLRSLFFRFFTYGFMPSAKRLKPSVPDHLLAGSAKAILARLSLGSGVNLMNPARVGIQSFTRFVIHPWWCRQRAPLYDLVMEFQARYVHH